jgi:hypothetical protein
MFGDWLVIRNAKGGSASVRAEVSIRRWHPGWIRFIWRSTGEIAKLAGRSRWSPAFLRFFVRCVFRARRTVAAHPDRVS